MFTHKHHTDISYLACARALIANADVIYPQFATHNAGTIAAIIGMAKAQGAAYEMQRLHGMGEGVYREVMRDSIPVRVYAPVGEHRDLLAYLVRRLLENGANSSFVHQLSDHAVDVDALLASPLAPAATVGIAPPAALYAATGRVNSTGVDLACIQERAPLDRAVAATAVPTVNEASPADVDAAMARLHRGFTPWNATPLAERAAVLRRAADALDARLPEFCGLLVKEAHKTLGDCVAEVREAVDFCRYYADQAEARLGTQALPGPTGESNELHLHGRGVFVCISPWNFPLAIFAGQVAAALVAGNSGRGQAGRADAGGRAALRRAAARGRRSRRRARAAARPGRNHRRRARRRRAHRRRVLHRLDRGGTRHQPHAGAEGRPHRAADRRDRRHQRDDRRQHRAARAGGRRGRAKRVPLGRPALLGAAPAVRARGRGRRVIEMIRGALLELNVGDPALLATDVGPVIDAEAFEGISAHIARLRPQATLIGESPVASSFPRLIAPIAFELPRIGDVKQEIFGPVLHVVRWGGDVDAVIAQINALGYGLDARHPDPHRFSAPCASRRRRASATST